MHVTFIKLPNPVYQTISVSDIQKQKDLANNY